MKKFGCISPSLVELPWDLQTALPEDVQVKVVTLNVRYGRPGEQDRQLTVLRGATDVLIDEGAEAIVVLGAVALHLGLARSREVFAELTSDRGAVPIVSTLEASALGMQHLGVKRPLLITQHDEQTNARNAAFLRQAGIEPVGIAGLGAANSTQVNTIAASDFEALANRTLPGYPTADGIFLSGRTSLFDLATRLEASIGLPVIEQTRIVLWWTLSQLGHAPLQGKGRLLSAIKPL